MLPPFNGRSWSHMKQNCWGGKRSSAKHTTLKLVLPFICVLCLLTPPHLPTTTVWNPPTLPPLERLHHYSGATYVLCAVRCLQCCLRYPPKVGLGQLRALTWGCLLYPVTFRIAILLSNFNKIGQDSFADKKTHNQSYKFAPLSKWV